MRFTSIFVAGALAIAARAQSPTEESSSTPSSVTACLEACDANDIGCFADCAKVPNPTEQQVIDTTACFAECEQGDGTEEQTAAYIECTNACVLADYYDENEVTPTPTGGDGSDDEESSSSTEAPADASTTAADSTETVTEDTETVTETSVGPTDSSTGTATEENNQASNTETDAAATETDNAATTLVGSIIFGGLALALAL